MSELKQYFRFPFQDRESRSRFALGCALMLAGMLSSQLPVLIPALRPRRGNEENP